MYTSFSLNLFTFESSVDQKLPVISDMYFFLYCSVPSAPTSPIHVILQLIKLT